MVRPILLICLFISLSIHCFSQQVKNNVGVYDSGIRPEFEYKSTPEERSRNYAESIRKEFQLSKDTALLVYRITLKFENDAQSQIDDRRQMTEYEKAIMQKLRKDHHEKVRELIREDLREKFDQKMKHRNPSESAPKSW